MKHLIQALKNNDGVGWQVWLYDDVSNTVEHKKVDTENVDAGIKPWR